MIKFVLKIFNVNGSSFQIRSKQRTSGARTKQCGMSFELSEFQSDTIKQASHMRMHKPQIRIVNHDPFTVITWFGTHIIVHGSKSSDFIRSTFKLKIQLFVFMKNLAKQLILIVTKGSIRSRHHFPQLLLLLVPEVILLLALTLIAGVVPVVVVVLVGGVELLLLGAVGDEVGGVIALEAAPR
jgi:hypothetical protein